MSTEYGYETDEVTKIKQKDPKTSPFYSIKDQINKIVIKDGVTLIGDYMFAWSSCQEVQIGRGVVGINPRAFYCCTRLTSVTIPGNVQRIYKGAFRGCTSLAHCELSRGLKIIGHYAFYGTPLTVITLPDGLQSIYENAFLNTKITSVVIPASVTSILEKAFGGPAPLSVVIGTSNVRLGNQAFAPGSVIDAPANIKVKAIGPGNKWVDTKLDDYARSYNLRVSYLECTPSGSLPIASHTMDRVEVVKEATCTEMGERVYTCTKCGYTKTEKIPLKPHSFGNWQMLSEPTVLDTGVQGRVCTVCGYTERQETGKLQATIQLNTNRISLKAGETFKLRVIAKSKGDSVVSWKSSDKSIAKVGAAGKVTAKAPGTVTVTATMESGISASVTVVVKRTPTKKLSVSVSGATMRSKKITVKARKSFTLVPKVTPSNSTDKVTYKSSKQSVVAVSAKGRVTALRKGKAKITVKSGKKKVVITVTVS